MKKLNIAFILLLLLGMQGLVAQDAEVVADVEDEGLSTLTAKITPKIKGQGTLGSKESLVGGKATSTAYAEGFGSASIKLEVDVDQVAGAVIKSVGKFDKKVDLTLDQVYAYAHVLKAFGVDSELVDLRLQLGVFNAGLNNATDAGTDKFKKYSRVQDISKEGSGVNELPSVNMATDLKFLDMLTLGVVLRFDEFDHDYKDGQKNRDIGMSLKFKKTFADDHTVKAGVAYAADLSNKEILAKKNENQDLLGFTAAYTGKFGVVKVAPHVNILLGGLNQSKATKDAKRSMDFFWSAGIRGAYLDQTGGIELVALGLDFGGKTSKEGADKEKKGQAFDGIGIKLSTDALKTVMGDNYLSAAVKVGLAAGSMDVSSGVKDAALVKAAANTFGSISVSLSQYLVNKGDNKVKLNLGFTYKNLVRYSYKKAGVDKPLRFDENGVAASSLSKIYFDLGLETKFAPVTVQSKF